MADAKPSGPGRLVPADLNRRPEVNIRKGDYIVRKEDGTLVHRRTYHTGSYVDSVVQMHESYKVLTEKQFKTAFDKDLGGAE